MTTSRYSSPSKNRKINVVLITPDQMRADHLSHYGYFRKTTPCIDKLAQEGTVFKRHYAVAPWTTPSFCSMMSSLTPSRHGATLLGSLIVDSTIQLLSEQFEAAEYRTVAFCNNALASRPLERGFYELYEGEKNQPQTITEHTELGAQETNRKIFEWLNQHCNKSFFMWILYFEPHSPYNPPPDHDIFKTSAYPNQMNTGYTAQANSGHLYRLANAGDEKAVQRLNSLYDGKIHFVDFHVGEVLKKLKELNLDGKTLIVLTSDHGELLYEHVNCLTFDHRSLYDSVLHVPLILRGPSLPRGKSIEALTMTLDIAPTILQIAGLPPLKEAQGRSLSCLITGKASAIHEYIFAEQDILEPLRSVRNARYKLIYHLQDAENELYDTVMDPSERKDIAGESPGIVRTLNVRLRDYMKRNESSEKEKLHRWRQNISSRVIARREQEIIDEVTIGAKFQFFGTPYQDMSGWVKMADGGNNYGNACYWMEPGEGSKGALWRSDNPLIGMYNIYVWYGRVPQRRSATNAHFVITTRQGSQTFRIDQNINIGKWNLLGRFEDPLYVKVTNDADGPVIMDAIKFELIK